MIPSNAFSLFDKLFAARKPEETRSDSGVGLDRHQIEKMEARREAVQAKGDRLRARPRGRSRPVSGRVVRGYMENPGAE